MPILPDPSQNFIHALSSFWNVFFKDTTQLQTYYKGVEINLGQLYLELLETVLGTNLRNIPVFSKQYYKQFTIGENELFYIEGASTSDDRYVFTPPEESIQSVPVLMNRVIMPTNVLETVRDYEVVNTALSFHENIFDVDGIGTSLSLFPIRVIIKEFPAEYRDPIHRDWKTTGVRIGDYFRFRILGTGSPFQTRITGIIGDTLLLESTYPEFKTNLSNHQSRITILRTPFDKIKKGISLPNHPTVVERLSSNTTDATLIPGTTIINYTGEPYEKGSWIPFTIYNAGDIVISPGLEPVRAIIAHTSSAIYDPTFWDSLAANKYFYVHHPDNPLNDGLYAALSVGVGLIQLNRPGIFLTAASMRAEIYMISYADAALGSPQPILNLIHSYLDPGSLTITARRKHDVYKNGIIYPANEAVIENIDYTVDYENGLIRVLSGWDPLFLGLANYTWNYVVTVHNHTYRGPWVASTSYIVGDIILYTGNYQVCITSNSDVIFTPGNWTLFLSPFSFNQTHPVRQMALWGADVLYDRETLYTNFGYLLSFKRPSSEQYRTFLRGVAQLFVIGPTLERFESALNVMADLPVIRDDGEILKAYDNGIFASGIDGQLIDTDEGRDGILTAIGSTFTSPSATFFLTDIGAILRVKIGTSYTNYTITSILSPTNATVSPIPIDAINLTWNFTHTILNHRFRTSSYAFTQEDVDAEIIITDAANARNNGIFRIISVENISTVILDTEYGFLDEENLVWKLSRSKIQTITTSRIAYTIPIMVPVRLDILLPTSLNTLIFQAFEPITEAFRVTDYVQDPTWWHNVAIPPELLALTVESAGRRRVSPTMIEHKLHPMDGALIGDFGLAVNVDDEGYPGILRNGTATWFGTSAVVLSFGANVPKANAQDIGRYLTLQGLAQFQITSIDVTGTVISLDRFPPPELKNIIPPVTFPVVLSPLLFRRTIAFIMMDRYLKYHALSIQMDPATPISPEFLGEAIQLLQKAKPGFTYVYFETPLNFLDTLLASDQMTVDVGFPAAEPILAADNSLRVGPPGFLTANDAYRFTNEAQIIPAAPGIYVLTPILPLPGPAPRIVRFHVVKGWFDLSVLISGRRLTEDVDYTLDRINGLITILPPGLPGPTTFNYIPVILRTRLPGDLLDPGETPICVNGTDPTTDPPDVGLIDRAVQLTIGP